MYKEKSKQKPETKILDKAKDKMKNWNSAGLLRKLKNIYKLL